MKTVGDIITEVALKRRAAKCVKTTSCSEDQIECAGCQANLPMWSNAVELGQMQELALHVVQLPQWCTLPNHLHQGSGELMFPHASTSAHPSQGHWSSLSPHPEGSNLSFLFLQAFHQIVAFFVGTFQIWRFYLVWVQLWLLWLAHFNFIFFPGVYVIHFDKKKLLGPNPLG